MELGNLSLLLLMFFAVLLAWYSGYKTQIKSKNSQVKKDNKFKKLTLNLFLMILLNQFVDKFDIPKGMKIYKNSKYFDVSAFNQILGVN